ncbi:MAG: hypothetical protein IJ593_06270 [Lachnospiraceae bacterium]|nr:hypothetical protein [Lachnospiraceae bacterium]
MPNCNKDYKYAVGGVIDILEKIGRYKEAEKKYRGEAIKRGKWEAKAKRLEAENKEYEAKNKEREARIEELEARIKELENKDNNTNTRMPSTIDWVFFNNPSTIGHKFAYHKIYEMYINNENDAKEKIDYIGQKKYRLIHGVEPGRYIGTNKKIADAIKNYSVTGFKLLVDIIVERNEKKLLEDTKTTYTNGVKGIGYAEYLINERGVKSIADITDDMYNLGNSTALAQ